MTPSFPALRSSELHREILARAQQRLAAFSGHSIDHKVEQVERSAIAVPRTVKRFGFVCDPRVVMRERQCRAAAAFELGKHILSFGPQTKSLVDRQSVVQGKSMSISVALGGGR